jgi:hypothetical protein
VRFFNMADSREFNEYDMASPIEVNQGDTEGQPRFLGSMIADDAN